MSPEPTPAAPDRIFEAVSGFQGSSAIEAAIDLDLFTAIGEGADTPSALAKRCDASERGVRILSDFLVTLGFLAKSEETYALTSESAAFLDRRSPSCLAPLFKILLAPRQREMFRDLAAVARKGGPMGGREGRRAEDSHDWVEFARAFAPLDGLYAEQLANLLESRGIGASKILDIAAGHGLWGIAIAKRTPSATVVAVDSPEVVQVARANAAAAGLQNRYTTLGGDAFELEFGKGYDLALVTNFLPGCDAASCIRCLEKVHQALNRGGHVVVLDVIPNDDRVTPPAPAQFALTLLAGTPDGEVYTFAEYSRMLQAAGFESGEIFPLPPSIERVIISHKRPASFAGES